MLEFPWTYTNIFMITLLALYQTLWVIPKVYKSFICIARDFTSRQVINYTQECTYSCIINPKEVIDQFKPITFDWTCTFSTNTIWMKPNSNELSNEYNNLLTLSVTCKQNNMQMHTMPSMYGGKKNEYVYKLFSIAIIYRSTRVEACFVSK